MFCAHVLFPFRILWVFYLNKGERLYKVCLWKCFFWMCHCMVICSCKAKLGIQTLSIMFVNFSLDKICNLREWNGIDMCTHAGENDLWEKQRKKILGAVHWNLEGVQRGVGLLHCVPWDAINYCVWVSAQSSKLYFICSKYLQLYPSSASSRHIPAVSLSSEATGTVHKSCWDHLFIYCCCITKVAIR